MDMVGMNTAPFLGFEDKVIRFSKDFILSAY